MVHASRILFNQRPAFQFGLVEISGFMACVDELKKWKEAALNGTGPVLVINRLFEVVDYNPAFREYVNPAFDMRGHSVFTMRPWMNIDRGALANIFNQGNAEAVNMAIETTTHRLECLGYVLNNELSEAEKILVVLQKAIPKEQMGS